MDEYIAANRANWDDRTGIHLESSFYDVDRRLRDAPGPRPREIEALGDVAGLRLVHLQCHFGLETLAFARAGAEVTGLDLSPAAIEAARDLARRSGLEDRATFVCSDVYDATTALGHAVFDVVYVSLGSLCWLPSVDRWAEQVAALVAPGGRFYIHDGHPLARALADNSLELEYSYFEEPEPFVEDSERTYTDAARPIAAQRSYEWNHSLGEIVTALMRCGLQLQVLIEHDWTSFPLFEWMICDDDGNWTLPAGKPRTPLSFTLLATRPGRSPS